MFFKFIKGDGIEVFSFSTLGSGTGSLVGGLFGDGDGAGMFSFSTLGGDTCLGMVEALCISVTISLISLLVPSVIRKHDISGEGFFKIVRIS